MRVEQFHIFLYGALLFAGAWGISQAVSSTSVKLHLRAIFLALGLGFIVVPGHGEFVVAPVLACFVPPLRSHLIILGGIFFFIWWAVAFGLLKWLTHPIWTPPKSKETDR